MAHAAGHRTTRRTLAAIVAALALTLATLLPTSTAPAAAEPAGSEDVTAVLFQWTWTSVAQECTDVLGPAGYGWVQVSPPQEHVRGSQWWTSYQPVSYRIESKLGTRAEFAAMVQTCRDAGVDVIADVVINHMSGKSEGGTGFAGSSFQHYVYPGIYQGQDFNDCRRDIASYGDRWEVQHCNLVNLADLRTGSDYVRGRIAGYLNDLISLGVRGFRVDAAKHIPATDLAAIRSRLSDPSVYVVQEVIGAAGEPVQDSEYTSIGDVHEFDYARNLKRVFTNERLAYLSDFGQSWGMLPSASAGVFVDNHDTERNGESLNQTYGSTYTLANVFMLAWPYGSPAVHSGYSFTDKDAGAPQHGDGSVQDATCYANGWRCQHDWRPIRNMVGFHNAVDGTAVTRWWSNGNDQIAFGRGDKGYAVINQEGGGLSRTFATSLPAGTYCDVVNGEPTATGCSGATVTVRPDGTFTASVPANDALAVHVGARPGTGGDDGGDEPGDGGEDGTTASVSFGVRATTVWGQNLRVVGDHPALGSWDPTAGVALSSATYPVWRAQVALPAGATVRFKYVRVDGAGAVVWESGADRVATVPASGVLTLTDTWRG
ncbi:carbohydrate-binding module family 20 domain-containing protein [Actinotalea ferrariae]|uniref:carbohydrate-binding module family 20 domain-containing protein n=1 Tax=Actinotalea ferrariae TaxID=1386098 RepID=UPI0021AB394B|nr:carbohydrate-binding module family 20 domain-containing protein [Actinotalea ferrariae]